MELKKVKYVSAFPVAILSLVITLISGIVQLVLVKRLSALSTDQIPTQLQSLVQTTTPLTALVLTPVVTGIVVYVIGVIMIFVYNLIAAKWPISWNVEK